MDDAELNAKWNEIRKDFTSSIMVDTKLASLAENVDLPVWPIEGDDETPSKYIYATVDELKMLPGIGDHPERIGELLDILKETLAFDDPFGEMVEQVEQASQHDDEAYKTIKKLDIPIEFPLTLTRLSKETKKLCKDEELETLDDFLKFSQNMAESIVVGGDYRSLLNSFSYLDEQGLAEFLPFRASAKGFHLCEAIAHIVRPLDSDEKLTLVKKYGGKLTAEEDKGRGKIGHERIVVVEHELQDELDKVFEWFKEEKEELVDMVERGDTLDRYFLILNDPHIERISINMVKQAFKGKAAAASDSGKGGLFGAIGRFFKK